MTCPVVGNNLLKKKAPCRKSTNIKRRAMILAKGKFFRVERKFNIYGQPPVGR